jgi:hypothetical protein
MRKQDTFLGIRGALLAQHSFAPRSGSLWFATLLTRTARCLYRSDESWDSDVVPLRTEQIHVVSHLEQILRAIRITGPGANSCTGCGNTGRAREPRKPYLRGFFSQGVLDQTTAFLSRAAENPAQKRDGFSCLCMQTKVPVSNATGMIRHTRSGPGRTSKGFSSAGGEGEGAPAARHTGRRATSYLV